MCFAAQPTTGVALLGPRMSAGARARQAPEPGRPVAPLAGLGVAGGPRGAAAHGEQQQGDAGGAEHDDDLTIGWGAVQRWYRRVRALSGPPGTPGGWPRRVDPSRSLIAIMWWLVASFQVSTVASSGRSSVIQASIVAFISRPSRWPRWAADDGGVLLERRGRGELVERAASTGRPTRRCPGAGPSPGRASAGARPSRPRSRPAAGRPTGWARRPRRWTVRR